MAPHCPPSPLCHLAPEINCPCGPNAQCTFQYHFLVHVLLLNFVYIQSPQLNPEVLEDWDCVLRVLRIFDLGTQCTVQFLELGRAQEVLLEELIPFGTTAVFAQIRARNIPGVLSVGGYFVLHLFCWKTNTEFNLWL